MYLRKKENQSTLKIMFSKRNMDMHTQKKLYSKSLRVQELSIVLVKQSYLVVEGGDKSAVAILRKLDRCDWTLG